MRNRSLAIAMLLAAATPVLAAQSPPPKPPGAPAATQPPAPSTMTPMSDDRRVKADDIDKYLAEGKTLLLDVREPSELEEFGTIEGAINIPIGQLEKRLAEIPKDRLILTA
jgi:3-mercaptopyruvate sulfurtransferase SseA